MKLNRQFFLLSIALTVSSFVHSAERPNIIFIFADDWGWGDLSCHGHPYVKTPHIDRLAKEGTDFYRFTVASGVCSPSRTAVMTGHFPARYNIDGHFAWVPSNAKRGMPDWLDPDAPLLPRMLQKAGYRTAHFGKWHLANNMIPDSLYREFMVTMHTARSTVPESRCPFMKIRSTQWTLSKSAMQRRNHSSSIYGYMNLTHLFTLSLNTVGVSASLRSVTISMPQFSPMQMIVSAKSSKPSTG